MTTDSMFPKSLYLFGAGASKGSTLSNKPPLMLDFFSVSKKMGIFDKYFFLWELTDKLGFNLNRDTNMEDIFSEFQILSSGLCHLDAIEYMKDLGEYFGFVTPSKYLQYFIYEVLLPTCTEVNKRTCKNHDLFCKKIKPGDTIVSLNYDTIIDESLNNTDLFHKSTGYGFPESSCFKRPSNRVESQVNLLKIHGSINWASEEKDFFKNTQKKLRDTIDRNKINKDLVKACSINKLDYKDPIDLFCDIRDNASSNFFIQSLIAESTIPDPILIPPLIAKSEYFNYSIFSDIWQKFREALSYSQNFYFIGTSFAKTDIHIITLLKYYLNFRENYKITIVNPDYGAFEKFKECMPKRMHHKIVHDKKYFDEFVKAL